MSPVTEVTSGSCTHTSHPGVCAQSQYQPWQVSHPHYLCVGTPELPAPLRHTQKQLCCSLAGRLQSWESSPTTSPWQPQPQRSQSTSYANERRPQMSAVITACFPSRFNSLLKGTAVHSSFWLPGHLSELRKVRAKNPFV